METGISEASKRVPIFSFATQGGKQMSSYFRQGNSDKDKLNSRVLDTLDQKRVRDSPSVRTEGLSRTGTTRVGTAESLSLRGEVGHTGQATRTQASQFLFF